MLSGSGKEHVFRALVKQPLFFTEHYKISKEFPTINGNKFVRTSAKRCGALSVRYQHLES